MASFPVPEQEPESGLKSRSVREIAHIGMRWIYRARISPSGSTSAERIHIKRLGRRADVISPQRHTMGEAVADHDRRAQAPPDRAEGGASMIRCWA